MHDSVAVIVVNWNGGQNLRRCVDSLLKQNSPPKRVIVVDNASEDGSLKGLEDFGSDIEVHRMARNLGFAAANNLALRLVSDCEWIALLNPDAFAATDWLAQLREAVTSNRACASFASRMLSDADPTQLDGAGDAYHFTGLAWRRGHEMQAEGRNLRAEEVFSACAGAALYRRDALVEVGGFDEAFFCYMEDVDLGFRLRLRGYRCLYVPTAVVRHVGSASTRKGSNLSVYYGHRNLEWTFFKSMPTSLLLLFLLPHVFANLYIAVKYAMRGQGRIVLSAKRDAVKDLRRVFRQRKQVQRAMTGSARDIARVLSYRPYRS